MHIAIDFDGTISSGHGFDHDPRNGAVDAINKLYDDGHVISIYSCRANPNVCDPSDVERMVKYLTRWGVKYHNILPNKPVFDLLVDDRTVNPNLIGGWNNLQNVIRSL